MNNIKHIWQPSEMDKFLECCKLQKLMQEVIENQKNGAIRVIKFMTKNTPPIISKPTWFYW